jgi:hypothetical protein
MTDQEVPPQPPDTPPPQSQPATGSPIFMGGAALLTFDHINGMRLADLGNIRTRTGEEHDAMQDKASAVICSLSPRRYDWSSHGRGRSIPQAMALVLAGGGSTMRPYIRFDVHNLDYDSFRPMADVLQGKLIDADGRWTQH